MKRSKRIRGLVGGAMGGLLGVALCVVLFPFLEQAIDSFRTTDTLIPLESAQSSAPSTLEITATDLYFYYQDNYVAADENYLGKTVSVTGEIDSIDKFLERPCITLRGDEHISEAVVCLFDDDSELSLIAELSEGDTITIRGRCDGVMFTNAPVWIKNCELSAD